MSSSLWNCPRNCHQLPRGFALANASGRDFPTSFAYTAKHIYKHLFRVFAHLYHAHFEQVVHLSIEAHFNSLFAHFLAFGKEFDLLVMKDLMTPQGMGQGVAELAERWREMGILEA